MTDEHFEWFKRNYELVKNLSAANDYLMVCKALYPDLAKNHRLYNYFQKDGIDCFVREGSMVAKFDGAVE